MTSSQRILLNTVVTYCHSVFAMVLGLFSVRWVLQALGAVDYGLMGVIGAVIVFITFLNGVFSSSCVRFFAYSIGREIPDEVNHWFNTALSVHAILPVVLIAIGYPAGVWAIHHFFNIPADRINTALWVFRFSLISAFTGMLFTPYMGMFSAKQRIYERSIWGILQAICMFVLAYVLTLYKGDCWLLYSGGTVSIMVVLGICQILRARYLFPECRIHLSKWRDGRKLKELISFSGWHLFGNIGIVIRGQGIAILLNKYFDPVRFSGVNAAYGIGNQVAAQTQALAGAMVSAFAPEITSSEGRGNRAQMLIHANRVSKIGTLLSLLFVIPLLLEMEYVLTLWLKKPPEFARIFCVLILVQFTIERLSVGAMLAVNAVGKIARYQASIGGLIFLTLPIAWLFLALGLNAASVGWALIFTTVMISIGRVVWAEYLVGLSLLKWGKEVLIPCVVVSVVGLGTGKCIQAFFVDASFCRVMAVGFGTLVSAVLLGWIIVLDETERHFFLRHLNHQSW